MYFRASYTGVKPSGGSLCVCGVYLFIDIFYVKDWGLQERAMVGSSESTGTDTGTFSSSSPPESVPDTADPREFILIIIN